MSFKWIFVYIYIYIFEEQKERRIVGKNLRYVILDFFSLSGDKKFTRKIFIFRYVISRGVDWKRGGDSRFLEQEWAQLCRESVRIAIFRKRSLGSSRRSSKNRVFATGWVFSGQRYLLRIAGNFTSLESSRGTRSHAIVVARKLPRFIFTILSKFLFYEKSPRLVYQTFKYLHPFFFLFLVFFFKCIIQKEIKNLSLTFSN